MSKKILIRQRIFLSLLAILLLLSFYEVLSYWQHAKNPYDTTIPSLVNMLKSLLMVTRQDVYGRVWLWDDLKVTLERLFLGLISGIVASVFLGVVMGCFSKIEAFLLPVLSFFSKIPPTAMLAVFFVLVGHERGMFVSMIAFGTLPTLAQAVYQAARYDVPEELVNKAYTLGANNAEVIVLVVFRMILPRIIEAVRLQVGPAMVFLIAAEWAVADVGFGYRLRMQSRLLNMAVVYDYILVLGVLGVIFDFLLIKLRKLACPWFV